MTEESSRIVQLSVSNVKRIRAIQITPGGKPLIVVGGNNGHGKSSTLDAIMYALAGTRSIPGRPLRDGAKKGEVEVDLGNLLVKRTFTESGGGTLKVSQADGVPLKSPQGILDELVGSLTFDPLAFRQMKPSEQAETLRKLVGLDTSEIDSKIEKTYQDRRDVGRDAKRLKGAYEEIPDAPKDTPANPIDINALTEEFAESTRKANALASMVKDRARMIADQERIANQIAELEDAFRKVSNQIDLIDRNIAAGEQHLSEIRSADQIRAEINNAELVNTLIVQINRKANLKAQLAATEKLYADYTEELESLKRQRVEQITSAQFPVTGLSIDPESGAVIYNGIPFDQSSQAESIRVSVDLGLAMNPKLRVMLVRDGSLLDSENLALLAKLAEERDAQVWLERVGKGKECSVVIEDGAIELR